MKKSFFFVLFLNLALAIGLQAQGEPQKSPPMKNAKGQDQSAKEPTVNPGPMPSASSAGENSTAPKTNEDAKPIDQSNFDTSVKPSDDFFLYANGGWIKRTEIPPEYTRWGSFNELIEHNNDALHEIAEKAEGTKIDPRLAPNVDQVGDFYASGMDENTIESLRTKPLDAEFKAIDAINDRAALEKEIAHLHSMGIGVLFNFGSHADSKDSTHELAQALQGGLGLPDRDYYTKIDDASKKLRDQYVDHVTKMLTLLGDKNAADEAKKILALETKLAEASRTRVQLRDPIKNYNKMTLQQLQDLTPDWKWNDYFKTLDILAPENVNVHQPEFFKAADQIFKQTPLDDFKAYLRWHLINAAAPDLSKDFVDEDFNFGEKILRGAQQIKPRWKRVIEAENGAIGEALGKLYVAYNFPPEAKARALELVNNLKEALADRIKTLEWMDEPTKQQALKKLAAMNVKIGYPDKWLDYSMLKIDRGPYVLNELRAAEFENNRELKKIGKKVDPTEWGMTPPTVTAYYQPNRNEIVFPAGILQPPFFYATADDAVNYGGIGCVIGHEMTHGFDDQGRQFDADGNLRDWWSPKSAEEFKKRAQMVINQYNEYQPLPGQHVNGELTQGENIADIGGVKLAYAALQKALAKHPEQRNQKIDGFTPEQRFFLSFAAIWRQKIRDEEQKLRLNTDPHSPAHFRVNGPLSDLPEFAKAFNVPANAPMVRPPDKRANIW